MITVSFDPLLALGRSKLHLGQKVFIALRDVFHVCGGAQSHIGHLNFRVFDFFRFRFVVVIESNQLAVLRNDNEVVLLCIQQANIAGDFLCLGFRRLLRLLCLVVLLFLRYNG